jgi:O-antigen ligase
MSLAGVNCDDSGGNSLGHLERVAASVLACGLIGCVLAFVHAPTMDVDGFDAPKELVLFLAAFGAGGLLLPFTRRLTIDWVDGCLLLSLLFGIGSAAARAVNGWQALCSLGASAAALSIYWSARALAACGAFRLLLGAIAAAIAAVVIPLLIEAYVLGRTVSLPGRGPGGTLGIRNYAAHLIAIGMPALIWTATRARRQGIRWATTVLVGMAAMALVLTRCRAAWFALLCCGVPALAYHVLRHRSYPRISIAVALGATSAILLPTRLSWSSAHPYRDTLAHLVDPDQGTGRGRLQQYRNTLRIIATHPLLGVGAGNWSAAYPGYAPPTDPSNRPGLVWQTPARSTSDWLGFLAERGIFAFTFFLMAMGGIARRAIRRARSDASEASREHSIVVLASLAIAGMAGAFDSVLQLAAPSFLLFLVMGSLGEAVRQAPMVSIRMPPFHRALATVVIAAMLLGLGTLPLRQVIAVRRFACASGAAEQERAAWLAIGNPRLFVRAAGSWRREGHCEWARELARRALALSPGLKAAEDLVRCPAPISAATTDASPATASSRSRKMLPRIGSANE